MANQLGSEVCGLAQRLIRLDDDPDGREWAAVQATVGTAMREAARRAAGDPVADDAVQEALILLRRSTGVFRRSGITEDDEARRWCLRVAANAARKLTRSMYRRRRSEDRACAPSSPPIPSAAIEAEELTGILHALIARLPGPERSAIEQRLLSGHSAETIGNASGHCATTVRWRLRRALDQLRTGLRRAGYLVFALAVSTPRRAFAAMSIPPAGSLHGLSASLMKGILMSSSILITTSLVCALFTGAMATPASAAASTPHTLKTSIRIAGQVLAFDGTFVTIGITPNEMGWLGHWKPGDKTMRFDVRKVGIAIPKVYPAKPSDIKVGQRVKGHIFLLTNTTFLGFFDWPIR